MAAEVVATRSGLLKTQRASATRSGGGGGSGAARPRRSRSRSPTPGTTPGLRPVPKQSASPPRRDMGELCRSRSRARERLDVAKRMALRATRELEFANQNWTRANMAVAKEFLRLVRSDPAAAAHTTPDLSPNVQTEQAKTDEQPMDDRGDRADRAQCCADQ